MGLPQMVGCDESALGVSHAARNCKASGWDRHKAPKWRDWRHQCLETASRIAKSNVAVARYMLILLLISWCRMIVAMH
jgi:hypothetical protein